MATSISPGGIIDPQLAVEEATGARLLRYDPREVKFIFGALPVHLGIASGSFITIERNAVTWRLIVGTDGEVVRVRGEDFSARCNLTLRKGTWVNDALSAIEVTDEKTAANAVPVFIVDMNGRSLHHSPAAFLEGPTNVSYGTGEGANTWQFLLTRLISYSGGLRRASE